MPENFMLFYFSNRNVEDEKWQYNLYQDQENALLCV